MITVLAIICSTIVICTGIRYGCHVYCQNVEYSIYKDLTKKDDEYSFSVRPYFFKNEVERFWGYVVYDDKQKTIYTGINKENSNFTIFRKESEALELCKTVRRLHGI